ncbi:MAG: insulinase family protein, partial [Chlorobi bacterium]|nr:insulinase family protein [Chlorobiota bacterium]
RISFISKNKEFNEEFYPYINLFNEFYGAGLSSIVFQEIRESRGLVYSAYAYLSTPKKRKDHHYLYAALSTQPDKMKVAMDAMTDLLNNMPEAEKQFEAAKESALKKLESKRVTKSNIFWTYLGLKKLGIDYNIDKETYAKIKEMTYEDFKKFFKENIANKKFDITIVGKKDNINFKQIKEYGKIEELGLDDIFNY